MSTVFRPSHVVARTAFRTSRMLDFLTEKDLAAQCGHPSRDWALVVVKELIDNALDACEEQGIAPEISVMVDDNTIAVADNGSGIPPEIVEQLLDFSIKVSSREAYVAPDRGAQGNALKTLIAMPFVLDGRRGRVDIVGGGVESRIAFGVDHIRQRPVADVDHSRKDGSLVRIHWPSEASFGDGDDDQFLQDDHAPDERVRLLCSDFTFLNPHLTLTLDYFGETTHVPATAPDWESGGRRVRPRRTGMSAVTSSACWAPTSPTSFRAATPRTATPRRSVSSSRAFAG